MLVSGLNTDFSTVNLRRKVPKIKIMPDSLAVVTLHAMSLFFRTAIKQDPKDMDPFQNLLSQFP